MRSHRNAVPSWCLLIGFAVLLVSPNEMFAATQSSTVTKDPAAVAALTQMAAATGWNPLNLPQDAVATGAAIRTSDGANLTFTLKIKGLNELRYDVQNGTALTTTIVNSGQAAQMLPDGTARFLGLQDAASIWPVDVPIFSNLSIAATAPNFSVSFLGTETVNSAICNKIQITAQIQSVDPITAVTSRTASIIIWLDATTALPVQLQYTRLASNNPTAFSLHIRQFSNYQQVNGMQVALTQQEFMNGRLLYAFQFSAVNFNVGLSDADFALPGAQQGGF
jgi:hypothetical protein